MSQNPPRPLSEYKKDISHGVWFFIHTMAEAAKTPELMRAYAAFFRNVCDKMGCGCENHCLTMLKQNPPEDYFGLKDDNGVPYGCLYHSVLCHNLVNERLGKPQYSYDQIAPLYRGGSENLVIRACEAEIAHSSASARPSEFSRQDWTYTAEQSRREKSKNVFRPPSQRQAVRMTFRPSGVPLQNMGMSFRPQ